MNNDTQYPTLQSSHNADLASAAVDGMLPGVVELQLLLPSVEAVSLEAAAHKRGVTAAQLVRSLLRGFLGEAGNNPTPRTAMEPA